MESPIEDNFNLRTLSSVFVRELGGLGSKEFEGQGQGSGFERKGQGLDFTRRQPWS